MPNLSALAMPKLNIQSTKTSGSSSGSIQSPKDQIPNQSVTFQHYLKNQSSPNTTEEKGNVRTNQESSGSSDNQIQPKEIRHLKQVVDSLSKAKGLSDSQTTLVQQLEALLKGPSVKMISFLKSDMGKALIHSLQETVGHNHQDNISNGNALSELFAMIQQIVQGIQNNNKTKTPTLDASDTVNSSVQKLGAKGKTDTGPNVTSFKKQEGQMNSPSRLSGTVLTNVNHSVLKVTQAVATNAKQPHLMTALGSHSGGSAENQQQKSTSDRGAPLSTWMGNPQQMGKVQQFLFHAQNAAPTSSPADQILTKIQQLMSQGQIKNASGGGLTVQLQLHPDTLGPVQLTITQTDEGLTALITAHSSMTKDLIEGQLTHLEQALSAGGIPIHKLDVSLLASQGSQQSSQDNAFQQPKDQPNRENNPQATYQETPSEEESTGYESFENWLNEVKLT